MVVGLGFGRVRGEVFRRRQRRLSRSLSPAEPPERPFAACLGRTGWRTCHDLVFPPLPSIFEPLGLPPSTNLARESLPRFLQAYDHPDYRASDVLLYGTQVENVALQPEQAVFAAEWNRQYAYPRLRYGTFAEALDAITRQQGNLDVVRGDGGPYWEDGLAANARITAIARSNADAFSPQKRWRAWPVH